MNKVNSTILRRLIERLLSGEPNPYRGILMKGLPGNGKSAMAKKLSGN